MTFEPKKMVNLYPQIRLDQIKEIEKMNPDTLDLFNKMCRDAQNFFGWLHRINSSYRNGSTGQHGKGKALDVVFFREKPGDVSVIEQFVFALKYQWGAIGTYPFWNSPGLHVDTRTGRRLYWWRNINGKYHYHSQLESILKWTA